MLIYGCVPGCSCKHSAIESTKIAMLTLKKTPLYFVTANSQSHFDDEILNTHNGTNSEMSHLELLISNENKL